MTGGLMYFCYVHALVMAVEYISGLNVDISFKRVYVSQNCEERYPGCERRATHIVSWERAAYEPGVGLGALFG
jgi:hypothetical protein